MSEAPIGGRVAPGFERVRDVFAKGFEHGEVGAGVSAYVDGRRVVDLWGGWADEGRTRAWEKDTLAAVFSATKGVTATCVLRLVEQGAIGLDEPVARYWPAFGQAGKDAVTVRMALSHQAGLPWANVRVPEERRLDWATMTDALARSAPVWPPGTRAEYHGGTFGYIVGEVLRQVDGRSLQAFWTEEIGGPLGADFRFTVGPEGAGRCAQMIGQPEHVGGSNTARWREGGDGSATALSTADGLARVYAALARGGALDSVRVLAPETIAAASTLQTLAHGEGPADHFGLGYELLSMRFPGLPAGTFGHTGMGGSIGLADPGRKLGFGFVMNRMMSETTARLIGAVYRAIG